MKLLSLVLILFGFGNCNAPTSNKISQAPDPERQHLLAQVLSSTQENHYQAKNIDDSFSKAIFESYLNLLDPEKVFFTKKDIHQLQHFKNSIDEELQNGTFNFFNTANQLLEKSVQKSKTITKAIFNNKIVFDIEEVFETDPKKMEYAINDQALKDRWRQKIKASILEELLLKDADQIDPLSNEIKKQAIEKTKRLITLELQEQSISEEKRFHQYLNTFLKLQDAQTGFLSVKERANWNAGYTRSLVGIGVSINIVKGYPKIENLTIGGPVWKNQVLQKGDLILEIKDPNKEVVETFGMSLTEVISLLKGEKGSSVELTIKRNGQDDFSTTIIRETIRYDLVLSLLLNEDKGDRKTGYIRIPRFYIGDEGSAYHVYQAIKKLKANQVEGIIIDLRNNHGGSAGETRSMLSYFLNSGVMMQTKSKDGSIRIIEDFDEDVSYDGELVILVNERSASGSELLSGTLQDYDRAVIVGGNATYGKGTMQRFFTFDNQDTTAEIGSSKMTIGTFYTASGRSPQHRGIIPDIILPNNFTYVKSGERIQETALPHQDLRIQTCAQTVNTNPNLNEVITKSKKRVKENTRFQIADQKARHIKKEQTQSDLSLDLASRIDQRKKEKQLNSRFETIFSEIKGFNVQLLPQDISAADSALIENNKIWQNNIQQDPYVYECLQVINDLYNS